jgi:hypothetical protein
MIEWPVASGSIDLQRHLRGDENIGVAGHKVRQEDSENPLPGAPTVGFVLRQVHLGYAQVVDLYVREITERRTSW